MVVFRRFSLPIGVLAHYLSFRLTAAVKMLLESYRNWFGRSIRSAAAFNLPNRASRRGGMMLNYNSARRSCPPNCHFGTLDDFRLHKPCADRRRGPWAG